MAPDLLRLPADLLSLLLFAALQFADAWTTHAIITRGGYEKNRLLQRLAAFLRRHTGARWAWLAIAKAFALAVFVWLVVIGAVEAQALLVLFYLVVIVHNIKILKGMDHGKQD